MRTWLLTPSAALLLILAAMIGVPQRVEAQVPAGPEFRVNTYTTYYQFATGIAAEPDGDFIVVWTSLHQDGHQAGVFGQRFTAAGALRGAEFRVSTYTQSEQRRPHVAVRASGDFVVVWDHLGHGETIVYGRRFDRTGAPLGGEFRVNQQPPGFLWWARVAFNPAGRFVVVWSGYRDGSGSAIMARVMDPSGAPLTDEFIVNTTTSGRQDLADVAALPDGGFVVVWQDHGLDPYGAIAGQRLGADGSRVGAEFRVDDMSTVGHWCRRPSISAGPDGSFIVVWTDLEDTYVYDTRARGFNSKADPLGPSFMVHAEGYGRQFVFLRQVAHDEAGNFVVTWQAYGDGVDKWSIFGQRFDAAGLRRGAEFRVDSYTTGVQTDALVASDAAGNFVVAWDGYTDLPGTPDTHAQRFGGLLPSALRIDTAGNGVWEPGESADLRPTWRNVNGAAQTIRGTLTGLQGPPPAVYGITDATGDYGTIANGGAVEASDYYVVAVDSPPVRPVAHWDASALETLVPDAMGQVKRWKLHIGDSFADVPRGNTFYRFVETLLHHGVTGGCDADTYCPAMSTTREQMSPFVLLAKEGAGYAPPACGTPMFPDVPASSPFCRWIEELARRGVVSGCGGGDYCPTSPVTRQEMAIFVLRTLDPALNPPACTTPMFADVQTSSPFCRWIEELARRGVVTGCGGGNYCPTAPVTRQQMSVFLTATFGLTLYGL